MNKNRKTIASFVATAGLLWVANTALYVDKQFPVFCIVMFGSGFCASILVDELCKRNGKEDV